MEKVGSVSLWIGITESGEYLDSLMEVQYSEDGDFEGSRFSNYFKIARYEDDFREAENLGESSVDIEALLSGFSYDDQIIKNFKRILPKLDTRCNTVILLYNFSYDGELNEFRDGSNCLRFVGVVDYELE